MNIKARALFCLLSALPVYALDDYRCTDRSLCELHNHHEVSSIDKAFAKGELDGQIRFAYISQKNYADDDISDPSTLDNYASSIGGQLKYETAKFNHVSLAASAYISQKIKILSADSNSELNGDFFDAEKGSFAYLGEAYIDYENKHLNIRIGRQKLDTPLNDRDDIRMLPNTFEAIMLGYGGIKDTILVAGYIQRWAGYDSGDDISKFKDLPGGVDENTIKGVYLAGVMNESIEDVELQVWYYDMDKTVGVSYIEAVYEKEYKKSGISVETAFQYGNYTEKSSSGIDGDIYGAMLALSYNDVSLFASYNKAESLDAKSITLGFGGGPYFTSMEEMTVDSINDASAYVIGSEVDFSKMVKGLVFAYAYGKFDGDSGATEYEENDFILSYILNDSIDIEASYASVNDKINSGATDTGYDRLLVRANYNF